MPHNILREETEKWNKNASEYYEKSIVSPKINC